MLNFENLPLNPWMLVGTFVAVATVVFYIGKWVGGINAFKSAALGLLNDIRNDVRTLLDRVPAVHIARGSPLRLTELGKSVSTALDAPAWMGALAAELAERIAEATSPYDIQEFCLAYMRDEFDATADQIARIKQCAYDSGLEKQHVLEILALELRDKLLAQHGPLATEP